MASRPNSAVRANVLTMLIIPLNTVFVKEFLEIHAKLFGFFTDVSRETFCVVAMMFHVEHFDFVGVSRGTFCVVAMMFHVEHFCCEVSLD